MELKDYQRRALDALRTFLDQAAIRDHAAAYAAAGAVGEPGAYGATYRPLAGLPGVPYCCLRLPTGGGKTLLAAYPIGIARDTYLARRYPVVLWLVTSSAIADQTLGALKKIGHPYRQALEAQFGGAVRVLGIDERRQLRPQDMADAATVIVATVQSFRVNNVADRNVYRDDEELEPHFAALAPGIDLARHEDGPRRGKPIASFANLLKLHRPLVIVDEAHNFTSTLSGETFGRLAPAAVVEFTATPVRSNVIVSATAAELKAADMIKLPIHLSQHGSWQAAIAHAVDNRAWLEGIAAKDGGGIRPIALYQAQPAREGAEATVDVVKRHLIEDCRIPEDRIAVATGNQRELDGIDLFDPACIIEHVITVDALKEGWDCSFAYVFCSLASIRSGGAVEQLLGRVLRMPSATRRSSEELNRAYAHVSERNFFEAAEGLKDRLTQMGFDERTALEAIVEQPETFEWSEDQPLFTRPELPLLRVQERPDQSSWTPEIVAATRIADDGAGGVAITFDTAAPDTVLREVAAAVTTETTSPVAAMEAFLVQRASSLSPAEQGEVLTLPRLAIERDGQLEIVFPETLVDVGGWDLRQVDTSLPGFALTDRPDTFEMDVDGDQVVYSRIDAAAELALDDATDWDVAALSRWLDRTTRQRDVAQPIFLEYCRRVVEGVADRIPLAQLVRGKYALRRAIIARVAQLRHEAGARGVQLLLGDIAPVLALGDNAFSFSKAGYDPRTPYAGPWRPRKHLFSQVGDLKHGGEEWMAAVAIDDHPAVHRWVRNVDRTAWSYALPTATDQFYPDFVAELADGRKLIVEYKGADRTDNADSREKKNIGARLQEVSGGGVVFLWAEKDRGGGVTQQLDAAIG
ncbi:MAG: DEAD/DEAH box helicase family protein [Sphingomonas sp.]|jgi:type III restriction enzyme|uniref:DEAD/DEAH box helicase n=1 Tax=Sphingomonas TaxID=13687 RepID=UPI000362BED2|nr:MULTISPECIES: DEAD/DEAH box helicase family protein [Sphingomonas]ATI57084.1 type III restriction endonuclease subunit R [Sphingomonas melonis]MBI0531933.1 type III restriction endonuclease subunit R [Sphingomonas sp. TX0522]MBX8846072.1 DEAD/DEAH box helicase family protein [Sphingomonas melonis]MBX8855160.1 DEAD/DEAH box helicase family protein [Sphingomonas melonis]MBX8899974.1 DEAD/DEAH box helicase family protein [Sphingomonas melonis]